MSASYLDRYPKTDIESGQERNFTTKEVMV